MMSKRMQYLEERMKNNKHYKETHLVVSNPLDDLTCEFCLLVSGKKAAAVGDAPPFDMCENMDNEIKCRCFYVTEQEEA